MEPSGCKILNLLKYDTKSYLIFKVSLSRPSFFFAILENYKKFVFWNPESLLFDQVELVS